eukprot:4000545-Amphidinium_carterae.1
MRSILCKHYWAAPRDHHNLAKILQYPEDGHLDERRISQHQSVMEEVLALSTRAFKRSQLLRVFLSVIDADAEIKEDKGKERVKQKW